MLAIERLKKIEEILNENGSIIISSLSETMGVSEETIRRDLEKLSKTMELKRVHGGAYKPSSTDAEVPINIRKKIYLEEKQLIGEKCATMINDGESVMLGSSTTALYVAKNLKNSKKKVTVITNSHLIVNELLGSEFVKVISIGGIFRRRTDSFVGHMAVENLKKLSADKAFISCSAITKGIGATDNHEGETIVRQTMFQQCAKRYLIIDHTKFNSTAINLVADIKDIDAIITDQPVTDEYKQWFEKNKVEIVSCR